MYRSGPDHDTQYYILKLFTKSVNWAITITTSQKIYQAADIIAVRDEKLFSATCTWTNHCLHHLLPSGRDTGHNRRHRGHSYQLVCYNVPPLRTLHLGHISSLMLAWCKEGTVSQVLSY